MKKKVSALLLVGTMLLNNIVPVFAINNILVLPSVKIDNNEVADKVIEKEVMDLHQSKNVSNKREIESEVDNDFRNNFSHELGKRNKILKETDENLNAKTETKNNINEDNKEFNPVMLEERTNIEDLIVENYEVKNSNNKKEKDNIIIEGNLYNKNKEIKTEFIDNIEPNIINSEKNSEFIKVENNILEYEDINNSNEKLQEFLPYKQIDVFNKNTKNKLDDISKDILEPLIVPGFISNMEAQPLMTVNRSAGSTRFEDSDWDYVDFIFEGNTLLGFSEQGKEKVKINKNLVLPGVTDKGLPVKEITKGAFGYCYENMTSYYNNCYLENVDFSNCIYLKKIGSFAFTGNDIVSLNLSFCSMLENIEWFAFAFNKIQYPILINNIININETAFSECYLDTEKTGNEIILLGNAINEELEDFVLNNKSYPVIIFTKERNTSYKDSILSEDDEKVARIDPWIEFTVNTNEEKTNKLLNGINLKLLINGEIAGTATSKNGKAVFDKVLIDNIRNKYEIKDLNTGKIIYSALADEILFEEKVNINYKTLPVFSDKWTYSDFIFEGNTLLGFSEQGKEKVKINKNLVLPGVTDKGLSVKEIGGFAFNNNNIQDVDFTNCENLKTIGSYAFMKNNIQHLDLSSCSLLKVIGDYAFCKNKEMSSIDFNNCNSLEIIGNSAFNENNIQSLDLSSCSLLEAIGDYAFYNNKIEEVNFSGCYKLEYISESSFCLNNIYKIDLRPCDKLWSVGFNAFSFNKITEPILLKDNKLLEECNTPGQSYLFCSLNFLDIKEYTTEVLNEYKKNPEEFFKKHKSYPIIALTEDKNTPFSESIYKDYNGNIALRVDPRIDFIVNVKDSNGKPITNIDVKLSFNNKTLTKRTNEKGNVVFDKYLIDHIERDIRFEIMNLSNEYREIEPKVINSTDIIYEEKVNVDFNCSPNTVDIKILNIDKNNNPISGSRFALYKENKKIAETISNRNGMALFRGLKFDDVRDGNFILKQLSIDGKYKLNNEEIAIDINNVTEGAIKTSFVNYNKEEYYLPETGTLGIVPYLLSSLFVLSTGIYISKKKKEQ